MNRFKNIRRITMRSRLGLATAALIIGIGFGAPAWANSFFFSTGTLTVSSVHSPSPPVLERSKPKRPTTSSTGTTVITGHDCRITAGGNAFVEYR